MIRKLFISLLVLGFFLFACRPKNLPDSRETPTPENKPEVSIITPSEVTDNGSLSGWRESEIYQAGLIDSQQANLAGLQSANEYHPDLNVSEDRSSVSIQQQVLLTNREDIPLEDLYFHVFSNYNGGRISFNKITIDNQDV
ncbi:MAG: M1 family metallopeptidase, partial [Anaerolineaceae bacterium]|nr:M1 family metallopeptidase [Anaerolineaceae bacterium]